MKKKNIKKEKSLYTYLIVAFIVILGIALAITTYYFGTVKDIIVAKIIEFQNTNVKTSELEQLAQIRNIIFLGIFNTIATIFCIGIGYMAIMAGHIIRPIQRLSKATKEIAKGNYDIELENTIRVDEIGNLIKNFNTMTKELKNNEYLQKDFVSNVSHEFKTPIATIQGYARLLEDEDLSKEERNEYIQIIVEETDRLSNLSTSLLRISKLENQEVAPNKKLFSVDEQLRKAIIALEPKISEKNIDIEMTEDKVMVFAEKEMLNQVWVNLIDNAIKFSNENGKIEIKVYEKEDNAVIEIKDNGIGIDKDKQNRIFDKFYQADKSHSKTGSGLGLSIVKRIITLNDGDIKCKSKKGNGTTFIVTIPKEEKS